jgi:hypothetical protein
MDFAERALRTDPPQKESGPHGWLYREGLSLHDAETLLDGLEACGIQEREMAFEPAGTVRVRWRE